MSVGEYSEMLEAQSGGCAICKTSPSNYNLSVDHSHNSGNIRGLLCVPCNTGIGSFRDSPAFLRQAALYLERSKK